MARDPKKKPNRSLERSRAGVSQGAKPDPTLGLAEQQRIVRGEAQFFSGPLPPPEILAKYNDIIPNAADRILSMVEKQEIHRQALEKTVIESDVQQSKRGLWAGTVLSGLAIVGGILLTERGHSVYGLAAMLGPLAGLAGAFIYGHWSRKRERLERSRTRGERTKD